MSIRVTLFSAIFLYIYSYSHIFICIYNYYILRQRRWNCSGRQREIRFPLIVTSCLCNCNCYATTFDTLIVQVCPRQSRRNEKFGKLSMKSPRPSAFVMFIPHELCNCLTNNRRTISGNFVTRRNDFQRFESSTTWLAWHQGILFSAIYFFYARLPLFTHPVITDLCTFFFFF